MIAITNNVPIHKGLVTHHHDHLPTGPYSVNFKTRNTRNTALANPIPELDEPLSFDMIFFFKLVVIELFH
jgi:hypothetical protein